SRRSSTYTASPETCLSALSCLTLRPTPVTRSCLNRAAISSWVLARLWLDISGHPRFGFRCVLFQEALAQQVLCDQQAVFAAGAEVGQRREVLGQGLAGAFGRLQGEGRANQRDLTGHRTLRNRRHAAEGDAGIGDHAVLDTQVEGRAYRGNVIVQTFGHLVGAEYLLWPGARNEDRSEEHTSELQSRENLVCRLLLEKKNNTEINNVNLQ